MGKKIPFLLNSSSFHLFLNCPSAFSSGQVIRIQLEMNTCNEAENHASGPMGKLATPECARGIGR